MWEKQSTVVGLVWRRYIEYPARENQVGGKTSSVAVAIIHPGGNLGLS